MIVDSFHQAALKIEAEILSAIEAAKEIHQLKDNLAKNRTNQFSPFTVRSLMVKLKDSGTDIKGEFMKRFDYRIS